MCSSDLREEWTKDRKREDHEKKRRREERRRGNIRILTFEKYEVERDRTPPDPDLGCVVRR